MSVTLGGSGPDCRRRRREGGEEEDARRRRRRMVEEEGGNGGVGSCVRVATEEVAVLGAHLSTEERRSLTLRTQQQQQHTHLPLLDSYIKPRPDHAASAG